MRLPDLDHTCVVGLQWGDEGKGKVVDLLLESFDAVARYNGGANAGHTIVIDGDRFALHQLPSGVLRERIISLITNGAVVDPAMVLGEIASLRERGIRVAENLKISDRAHVVFPYHRQQDLLAEQSASGAGKLGTTSRGIGPCYEDKYSRRWGIRICDLFDAEHLRQRVADVITHKDAFFGVFGKAAGTFDADAIAREYLAFGEQLRPYVCDTTLLLRDLMREGKRVLFEGAQGALLDIEHGTYPFVTSSHASSGGATTGAGVPPWAIRTVVGVIKAYTTRVGAGPMPTELDDDTGQAIREIGREYGTTTGRPRRCGWFDAVAAGYSAAFCGATELAVLHLDTLTGFSELKVCVGYRHKGRIWNTMPASAYVLKEVEPVYESAPGWNETLSECRRWEELPAAARSYLDLISRLLHTPIGVVGVGPGREQTIFAPDRPVRG